MQMTRRILAALILAAGLSTGAKAQDEFQARVFPRISMPGADLTVTVEHIGPLTEANYCLGIEVVWAEGNVTKHVPDCPPWEDFQRQQAKAAACADLVIVCPEGYECFLPACREAEEATARLQRRWTFTTRRQRVGYGPGSYNLLVRFLLPNGKTVDRFAPFLVGGGE